MKCDQIKKKLERFFDGELDPAEEQEVESHIRTCTECSAVLAKLQTLHEAGKIDFIPDPPKKYWNQLHKDITGKISDLESGRQKAHNRFAGLKRWIWPERISTRLVGLTATAVMVFFIVRIMSWDNDPSSYLRIVGDQTPEYFTVDGVLTEEAKDEPDTETSGEKETNIKETVSPDQPDAHKTDDLDDMRRIAPVPPKGETPIAGVTARKAEKKEIVVEGPVVRVDQKSDAATVADSNVRLVRFAEGENVVRVSENTERGVRTKARDDSFVVMKGAGGRGVESEQDLKQMIWKSAQESQPAEEISQSVPSASVVHDNLYQILKETQNNRQRIRILEDRLSHEQNPILRDAMIHLLASLYYVEAWKNKSQAEIHRALQFYEKHRGILKDDPDYERCVNSLKTAR